jgi:hypothetical protein
MYLSTSTGSRLSQSNAVRLGLNALLNEPNDKNSISALRPRRPWRRRSGDQAARVQRHRLEIRSAENRAMQAGAVVQQVGLGDVAAHAVPEQNDRQPRHCWPMCWLRLARSPTTLFQPSCSAYNQGAVIGSTAMAALVRRVHAVARAAQASPGAHSDRCVRPCHGPASPPPWADLRQPLIDEQAAAVIRGQPEGAWFMAVPLLGVIAVYSASQEPRLISAGPCRKIHAINDAISLFACLAIAANVPKAPLL